MLLFTLGRFNIRIIFHCNHLHIITVYTGERFPVILIRHVQMIAQSLWNESADTFSLLVFLKICIINEYEQEGGQL
ncbi:hypothetical protein CFK37_11315 [Virgibacillus phasianinus]|uniref:Uncharacterized protein n=1 Tax=Virgibacillus phasianinus TaxID=2017483 RepID=A0A220U3L3_9BACI|nr:hypothetical protein CFK37_11315 [Virgibacillus phasianinus]